MWDASITTAMNLGAMISAISAGFFMQRFRKWNMLVAMNVLLIVGSAISLYDNMYVICLGRFLFGLASGGFTVYAPTFTHESVPTEYKGIFSLLLNAMVALGLLVP